MSRAWVFPLATVLLVASCSTPTPADSPELPLGPPPTTQPPATSTDEPSLCDELEFEQWEWFELTDSSASITTSTGGVSVSQRSVPLPDSAAGRYNTVVEACPGLFLAISALGEVLAIAPDTARYAPLSSLTPTSPGGEVADRGVQAGAPTFGFRDALLVDHTLFLSDAVVDQSAQCVRVDVKSIALDGFFADTPPDLTDVFTSPTCVSYVDSYRPSAPIKTHMGGALAYHAETEELLVSIGDMHLGVSSISQAASTGIANTERDYELLLDTQSAISAVVAIEKPLEPGPSRVFAKGLRNSLGMTVDTAGDLWLSDHGPQGGDELNLIVEGADYGWPLTSEGSPYDRSAWPADPNQLPAPWLEINQAVIPGTTPAVASWSPAVAPTAVVDYLSGGQGVAEWADHIVIGSLRGQALIVVDREMGEVDRLVVGTRLRDTIADVTGRLISVTDDNQLLIFSSVSP